MSYVILHFITKKNKQYDQMFKYYLKAIKHKNTKAMIMLAHYYYMKIDEINMLKYLTVAIDLGDTNAMHNLAMYYHEIKNDDQMIKYLQMAIDGGNVNSMYHLATYYESRQEYQNMAEYLLVALDCNPHYTAASIKLSKYFTISEIESLMRVYNEQIEFE